MTDVIDPPKRTTKRFPDENTIHVRRVVYTTDGYVKGEYLGEFTAALAAIYDKFSKIWMEQHTDKDGNVIKKFETPQLIDSADEFLFCADDHFCIGIAGGILYEGINECYEGYPGMIGDEYGFEKMFDAAGDPIPYTKVSGLEDITR